MSKKRLSADDKKRLMLQLLHEKKDVFQLKDLERIAPKEKGIIAQSVKDVLQSLVDDSLVDSEKIGTSIYYWSFPSKAHSVKKAQLDDIHEQIKSSKDKLKEYEVKLCGIDPDESKQKEEKIERLKQIKSELNDLEVKLKDSSMEEELAQLKEKANIWTENIFAIKSFVKNKFQIEDSAINKQFEIPEDLDYV
jgi:hypothetical protein